LKDFDELREKKEIEMSAPLVSSMIGRNPEESIAGVKAEIVVYCESQEVLALLFHINIRARMKSGDLEKTV